MRGDIPKISPWEVVIALPALPESDEHLLGVVVPHSGLEPVVRDRIAHELIVHLQNEADPLSVVLAVAKGCVGEDSLRLPKRRVCDITTPTLRFVPLRVLVT